jgi:ribosomal protein S18 acetylase RimI-like enzyme
LSGNIAPLSVEQDIPVLPEEEYFIHWLFIKEKEMIIKCSSDDLKQMIELAFQKNNEPSHFSAFCPLKKERIKNEFMEGINSDDTFYAGVFENGILKGLMGCYVDMERRNTDCSGPFIEGDFLRNSKAMYDYARSFADSSMKYTFYFGKNNTDCIHLMELIQAENQGNEYQLIIKRENYRKLSTPIPVEVLPSGYTDRLAALHDTIFPDVYISGKGIVKSLGKDREVFCAMEESRLIAYSVLKTYDNSLSATAEIIGVDKDYRHRGYGRAVLNKLLEETFKNSSVEKIDLIVDKINENALGLYYSMGFELLQENCCYIVGNLFS